MVLAAWWSKPTKHGRTLMHMTGPWTSQCKGLRTVCTVMYIYVTVLLHTPVVFVCTFAHCFGSCAGRYEESREFHPCPFGHCLSFLSTITFCAFCRLDEGEQDKSSSSKVLKSALEKVHALFIGKRFYVHAFSAPLLCHAVLSWAEVKLKVPVDSTWSVLSGGTCIHSKSLLSQCICVKNHRIEEIKHDTDCFHHTYFMYMVYKFCDLRPFKALHGNTISELLVSCSMSLCVAIKSCSRGETWVLVYLW